MVGGKHISKRGVSGTLVIWDLPFSSVAKKLRNTRPLYLPGSISPVKLGGWWSCDVIGLTLLSRNHRLLNLVVMFRMPYLQSFVDLVLLEPWNGDSAAAVVLYSVSPHNRPQRAPRCPSQFIFVNVAREARCFLARVVVNSHDLGLTPIAGSIRYDRT